MTNPNSEVEEGELMNQDPVLTTLEEMLKVSAFKNSFAIIHHQKKNKFAKNLIGWSFNSNNTFESNLSILSERTIVCKYCK